MTKRFVLVDEKQGVFLGYLEQFQKAVFSSKQTFSVTVAYSFENASEAMEYANFYLPKLSSLSVHPVEVAKPPYATLAELNKAGLTKYLDGMLLAMVAPSSVFH